MMPRIPLLDLATWIPIIDGDATAAAMYDRHYSSARSRKRRAERGSLYIGGPSQRLILMTPSRDALFGWRQQRFRSDEQSGVECFIFRNEGPTLSSGLIRCADAIADARWPGLRHFTFVDASATVRGRSKNSQPGECFILAGWQPCGMSQERGLHILERVA